MILHVVQISNARQRTFQADAEHKLHHVASINEFLSTYGGKL